MPLVVAASLAAGCAGKGRGPAHLPDEGVVVSSPGGVVHVHLRLIDLGGQPPYPAGRRLYLRALHGAGEARKPLLDWSPLGLTRRDQAFVDGLVFMGQSDREVIESYALSHGKRSRYQNRGVERVLSFRGAGGGRLDVVVRVFDDGFAFRYRFPETDGRRLTVTDEATGFRLPPDTRATLTPHDRPGRRAPNHESPWHVGLPVGTPAPVDAGWSFPALFRTAEGRWLLVTESGLDRSYCATHLAADARGGLYRIAFPHPDEAGGEGEAQPSWTLPWETPWRVVIAGDRPATVVESSLVTDLAPPSMVTDASWVRPGRASWSWWSDGGSARSYTRLAAFVDLAAALGWEHSLVDAGWERMEGGTFEDLLRYARGKRVGLFFWYDSGVRARVRPRARLHEAGSRRAELARLAAAGAVGIKVDFFESDKQAVIAHYLAILEDAGASKLMVSFHGATLPRGWERTYPHLLTVEAVRGAEGYLLDPAYAAGAPAHNTVQVFTRNVVGPMDYTPVVFSASKHRRVTTWAHELALSVVFESGLQHFADTPDAYRGLPEEAQGFLRAVPAAWDETRFIEGEPGRLAVLARRRDRVWYVGGINGDQAARRVTVPLDFLGNGTYDMLILADGKTDASFLVTKRQRNATDLQAVDLLPRGGFAMRLAPLE